VKNAPAQIGWAPDGTRLSLLSAGVQDGPIWGGHIRELYITVSLAFQDRRQRPLFAMRHRREINRIAIVLSSFSARAALILKEFNLLKLVTGRASSITAGRLSSRVLFRSMSRCPGFEAIRSRLFKLPEERESVVL
jgi:hypothetical protein